MSTTPAPATPHHLIWPPLIALGLVLALWLPSGLFVCPFKAITTLPCLTCGGTRAVRALWGLDPATAWRMNPLVTVGVGAALLYALHAATAALRRRPPFTLSPEGALVRWGRWGLLATVIANWGYLLLAGR